MMRYLLAVGIGAGLAYLLDPVKGSKRREEVARQVSRMAPFSSTLVQQDDIALHTASTAEELSEKTAKLELDKLLTEGTQEGPLYETFPYSAHNA